MKKMQWMAVLAAAWILAACQGDQGGADLELPVVTSFELQSVSGSTVALLASGTDNVAVTGYCFRTNSTMPFPADACFQTSPLISGVDLTVTPSIYVWAKDAVGNVSAAYKYKDTVAPVVTALNVQTLSGTTATLSATASDNIAVAAYCFKTVNTAPLSTDLCFQASSQKSGVNLATTPATYVWAKDSFGNVSAALAGPCSATGYAASSASSKNTVCMMTDKGMVVLELDAVHAPITVANFLAYTNTGFFSNTVFHRIIASFMIQGGGQTYASGVYTEKGPLSAPIVLEKTTATGLSNVRGTIAMARTSVPDSATSQFFINVVDNSTCLDAVVGLCDSTGNGYAVFGKVIDGMAAVDLIKDLSVHLNGGELSQPDVPPVILWAYQLK